MFPQDRSLYAVSPYAKKTTIRNFQAANRDDGLLPVSLLSVALRDRWVLITANRTH
jgi:hypothetical protein